MSSEHQNGHERREPLIVGGKMRCPRCRQLRNILDYRPLEQKPEFEEDTNVVVRCTPCGWIFSPGGEYRTIIADFSRVMEERGRVAAA